MSVNAKAHEWHAQVAQIPIAREAIGYAREVKKGRVNGLYDLQLVEPIETTNRSGNLELALQLCYAAI